MFVGNLVFSCDLILQQKVKIKVRTHHLLSFCGLVELRVDYWCINELNENSRQDYGFYKWNLQGSYPFITYI